jgi:Domain of unknown function (DUF4190)
MTSRNASSVIAGSAALVLIVDMVEVPWYAVDGQGLTPLHVVAVDSPYAAWGVLVVLAAIAVIVLAAVELSLAADRPGGDTAVRALRAVNVVKAVAGALALLFVFIKIAANTNYLSVAPWLGVLAALAVLLSAALTRPAGPVLDRRAGSSRPAGARSPRANCSSCGAGIDLGDRFCRSCGAALEAAAEAVAPFEPGLASRGRARHGHEAATDPAGANRLARASLALGILWLWGIGALLALILGIVARNQIHDSEGGQSGERLAVAGIVLGVLGLVGAAVLTLVVFAASPSSFYKPGT